MLQPRYIPPDAGERLYGPAGDVYLAKLTSADTGGAFLLTQIDVAPGGGPPLHRHTREDEAFVVLAGELSFWADGRALRAGPGSVIYGPRNVPHTFKNCSTAPVSVMVLITPAVSEGFFRGFGEARAAGAERPTDEQIIERILKLAPEYGIEILGPSPL